MQHSQQLEDTLSQARQITIINRYETEIQSVKGEYMFENIRNNLDEFERICTKWKKENK